MMLFYYAIKGVLSLVIMLKNDHERKIGLLLLAAGEASRMGMPKQLLVYRAQPLIRHIIEELLVLNSPITVVLGARAEMIKPVINDFSIDIVTNIDWKSGMGVSMRVGLDCLQQSHPNLDGVLCCVVDQPYLTHELLHKYLEIFFQLSSPSEALLAAKYKNNTIGVPALLGANQIHRLQNGEDAIGARKLLRKHAKSVITIDFPEGEFDLDNQDDWEKFRSN